jgi:hypothetical protein
MTFLSPRKGEFRGKVAHPDFYTILPVKGRGAGKAGGEGAPSRAGHPSVSTSCCHLPCTGRMIENNKAAFPRKEGRRPLYQLSRRDQTEATSATSTFTPGPIEDDRAILRTYLPFEPDGFALTIASTKASKFLRRSSAEKLDLPRPA